MLNKHLIPEMHPIANGENVVFFKDYRITVLSDRLFRVEKSEKKKFLDDATQTVWFRNMEKQNFEAKVKGDVLLIDTDTCVLKICEKRADCKVKVGDSWLNISNEGNLLGTYRTLDMCDGDMNIEKGKKVELATGVCSKSGVAVVDDSKTLVIKADGNLYEREQTGSDEYVFAFGHDYKAAVAALFMICGKVPMIPRFALGNWWSRYHVYDDEEYLALMNKFEEVGIPITVATIDMDWHYSVHLDEEKKITELGRNKEEFGGNAGWTGYSWNKNLFPNPEEFLKALKEKNLKVSLNLHPASGIRWWEDCYTEMAEAMGIDPKTCKPVEFDMSDEKFINNYFTHVLKPHEKMGVDLWWIDWQQGSTTKKVGLDPLWALNHYHTLEQASDHIQPMILSRYAGLGSHRYPLGFSGDTSITWDNLKYIPYFTVTATNAGYSWWSHDVGGHHMGNMDFELFARSVQQAIFSPINRLHCTNREVLAKEPWFYGNGSGLVVKEWMKLRHKLIPFIYSLDYDTHNNGTALIEPLYYYYDENEAYSFKNQYIFGKNLMVAPITEKIGKDGYAKVDAWIPQGRWTDIFTGETYEIGEGGECKTLLRRLESIPVLAKEGTVITMSKDLGNSVKNPKKLAAYAYRGNGKFTMFEDGAEDGNRDEFFTEFEMKEEKIGEDSVQKLLITSHGVGDVVPKDRKIEVCFPDIKKGEVELKVDGKVEKIKKIPYDYLKCEIDFVPGKEYEISVKYRKLSRLDEYKAFAKDVLIRSEGHVENKVDTYEKLFAAKTLSEFYVALYNGTITEIDKVKIREIM